MRVTPTRIADVLVIEPKVFSDSRGFFLETYHAPRYQQYGIAAEFVQDNYSFSCRHTLRGLHYQLKHPQGKLVQVLEGEVVDVAVDIRRGSPTFGQWVSETLSEANHRQLYVPPGFAHGFCVASERARVIYKCTEVYRPDDEYGVLWSDTTLAIDWPLSAPLLSAKDAAFSPLSLIDPRLLPVYDG